MLSFLLFLFVLVSNNLFLATSPILPYLREESSSFDVVMVLLRNDEKRRDQKQLLLSALLRETTRRVMMLVKIDPLLAKALANATALRLGKGKHREDRYEAARSSYPPLPPNI